MNCQVVGKFFDVLKEMSDTEKIPKECGNGKQVYSAEINFLKTIEGTSEMNAVELSHKMNVTRSAVTQMSNKLEERGFIERYGKPDNKKEKFFKLTEWGKNILNDHERKHREANEKMCNYLSNLDNEQRDTLVEFLDNLKECMPISNFECLCKRAR